jgi:hypothetical protein
MRQPYHVRVDEGRAGRGRGDGVRILPIVAFDPRTPRTQVDGATFGIFVAR